MILTNQEIYNKAKLLQGIFAGSEEYFPAKVNFYLNKNVEKIFDYAQDLEKERYRIIKHYGNLQENGLFHLSEEDQTKAQNELNELLSISQDVPLKLIPLSWLQDLKFTPKQMQALLFMIEED